MAKDTTQFYDPDAPDPYEPPTTDLSARPYVQHTNGSVSTVYSMGTNIGGKELLVPTVSEYGYMMTPQQAADEYRKTGKHLGVYGSVEASDRGGENIHQDQMRHPPKDSLHGAGMLFDEDGAVIPPQKTYADQRLNVRAPRRTFSIPRPRR